MNEELKQIISQSTFEIIDGSFIYAKVASLPETGKYFMVSQDTDEITVVTKNENLATLDLVERNKDSYSLIALNVSVPFYSVGFLAEVSKVIAEAGMNILIISTYSKDYIMVREDKLPEAKQVFLSFTVSAKSFDCWMPSSDKSTSDQPDDIFCSLSVVVPWTK